MRRLRRWAFNLVAAVSFLLSVATCVLWVRSFKPAGVSGGEVPRGGWAVVNWRGQLAFVHHKASPGPPRPPFPLEALRGTWGTTTALLGRDSTGRPSLLVKSLVLDPAAVWEGRPARPLDVLAHPYVLVPVAEGCRPANGFGFALRVVYLPAPTSGGGRDYSRAGSASGVSCRSRRCRTGSPPRSRVSRS